MSEAAAAKLVSVPHGTLLPLVCCSGCGTRVLHHLGAPTRGGGRRRVRTCAASSSAVVSSARCRLLAVQEVSPGDWQPCKLLSLEGVLAYSHTGSVYYCPIQMYVQTKHPHTKPTVYVRPTPDMMIERGAEYVDHAGQITTPSLTSYSEHTGLANVLREMSYIFASAPPVRSRPSPGAMAAAGVSSGTSAEARSREAAALRSRVTAMLKADLGGWYAALCDALDKEEAAGATLREDKRALASKAENGVAGLRRLEEHVKAVKDRTAQLDRWLAASESGVSLRMGRWVYWRERVVSGCDADACVALRGVSPACVVRWWLTGT